MKLTDEQILDEFERRAFSPLRTADGNPTLDAVRLIEGVRALLSSKAAAPMGWKLVPVEPTPEMLAPFGILNERGTAIGSYHAMLAASPAAPAQSGEPVAWRHKWANDPTDEWQYEIAGPWTDKLRIGVPGILNPDSARTQWEPLYAAPLPTQPAEGGEATADRTVDDLAMLTKQLVHALRKHEPKSALACRTLDYLRQGGLIGSPLRAESAVALDDERAAFEAWCNSIPANRSMGPWEIWQAARAAPLQSEATVRGEREAVAWFDKERNTVRWKDGLINADFDEGQPFFTAAQPAQTEKLTYLQREHLYEAAQSLERSTDAYDSVLARAIREILTAAQPASGDKA